MRASGVATKQRVTFGLNQTLWQVVRSVTTVAKGMGRCKPPLQEACTTSEMLQWPGRQELWRYRRERSI